MQSGCMLKMKHVALLGALAFSSVFAAEVSPNDALCAVKGWMNLKEALGGDFDASPAFVTAYDGEATIAVQAYFIVSASPGVKKTFRPVASALSL